MHSRLAPVHQEFAVLIELRDARAVVSIGHEQGAVRQPRKESWPVEMRAIGAMYRGRANRLHEFLHVMREYVDGVHMIIHDPDMLLRIIRIDRDVVRPLEQMIVL